MVRPLYSVLFESEEEIKMLQLKRGDLVCYLPDRASYVVVDQLRGVKGSDASNLFDEEPNENV